MRKQPVIRRQFLGSGIAAAGAISIGGALPANAREWAKYSARFDRSISDGLPAGPLRPDDEAAWKAVAENSIKGQACDLCDSVEHSLLLLDMPFENRTNRKPDPVFDSLTTYDSLVFHSRLPFTIYQVRQDDNLASWACTKNNRIIWINGSMARKVERYLVEGGSAIPFSRKRYICEAKN